METLDQLSSNERELVINSILQAPFPPNVLKEHLDLKFVTSQFVIDSMSRMMVDTNDPVLMDVLDRYGMQIRPVNEVVLPCTKPSTIKPSGGDGVIFSEDAPGNILRRRNTHPNQIRVWKAGLWCVKLPITIPVLEVLEDFDEDEDDVYWEQARKPVEGGNSIRISPTKMSLAFKGPALEHLVMLYNHGQEMVRDRDKLLKGVLHILDQNPTLTQLGELYPAGKATVEKNRAEVEQKRLERKANKAKAPRSPSPRRKEPEPKVPTEEILNHLRNMR